MRRREGVVVSGGVAAASPLQACAQSAEKSYRRGYVAMAAIR
jgi:tRNA A37 threonylcarbamoyltransferase TsaD